MSNIVHYGSIEERLKSEGIDNVLARNEQQVAPTSAEYMDTDKSDETLLSSEQQEFISSTERKKKMGEMKNVPYDNQEMIRMLRMFGEPAILFGENPAERRERLRALLLDRHTPAQETSVEVVQEAPKANETWYHEGPSELHAARLFLASYSLPLARDRLCKEREHKKMPLVQRNASRSEIQNRMMGFSLYSSQVGDTRPVSYCSISPDGKLLATAGWSGLAKVFTFPEMKEIKVLRGHTIECTCVAWHPDATLTLDDSSCCLASCARDGSVKLWSLASDDVLVELDQFHQGYRVSRLKFHPSGRFLATCVYDNSWRLFDLQERSEILHQEGHVRPVNDIAFHPDGSLALSASLDCYGRVWDLRTGRCVIFLQGHHKGVVCCDISSNGYHCATGSLDNSIKIWDLRIRKSLYTIAGHSSVVSQVKFQPNGGNYLLSSSYDRTSKIWGVPNFNPLNFLSAHDNKVSCVDISKDENIIVTTSFDKTVKLWKMSAGSSGGIDLRYVYHSDIDDRFCFKVSSFLNLSLPTDVLHVEAFFVLQDRRISLTVESVTPHEWIELPFTVSQLPLQARLVIRVTSQQVSFATYLNIFSTLGVLHSDMIDLVLHKAEGPSQAPADTLLFNEIPGMLDDELNFGPNSEIVRLLSSRQLYHSGLMPRCEWLDRHSLLALEQRYDHLRRMSSLPFITIALPEYRGCFVIYNTPTDEVFPRARGEYFADPGHIGTKFCDNVMREKMIKLAKAVSVRPDADARDELLFIIDSPDACFLENQMWKYKDWLKTQKKALVKFLSSINFENDSAENVANVSEALELMEGWAKIDAADALELLTGKFYRKDNKYLQRVRSFAVRRLFDLADADVQMYLLQLVQALKLESNNDLMNFLFDRATKNISIANLLYWFLKVESDLNPKSAIQRTFVLYRSHLQRSNSNFYHNICVLGQAFADDVTRLRNYVQAEGGTRDRKIENLQKFLQQSQFADFEKRPLPLDASVTVTAINAKQASVYKSNLFPIRLTLITNTGSEYIIMFKDGDDLRQDQVVVQMIQLMDNILRKEHLDLCLTPYKVLAVGPHQGFIEIKPGFVVRDILQNDGSLLAYLKKHNPSPDGKGVGAEAMDRYLRSCAGYCVITYLLGVGDRHDDNVLLQPDGRLFHIDFGYLLGRDPKLLPPPMKLTKEMVDTMGGVNSDNFVTFKKYSYTAFQNLRRSANLFLNLLRLMTDANITDIASDAVSKVLNRFRLDLSEDEAIKYFQLVIDESLSAVFAKVFEQIHKVAMYVR